MSAHEVVVSPTKIQIEAEAPHTDQKHSIEVMNLSSKQRAIHISFVDSSKCGYHATFGEGMKTAMRFSLAPGLTRKVAVRFQDPRITEKENRRLFDNYNSRKGDANSMLRVTYGNTSSIDIPVEIKGPNDVIDSLLVKVEPSHLHFGSVSKERLEIKTLTIMNLSSRRIYYNLRPQSENEDYWLRLSHSNGSIEGKRTGQCIIEPLPTTLGAFRTTLGMDINENRSMHRIPVSLDVLERDIILLDGEGNNFEDLHKTPELELKPVFFGEKTQISMLIKNLSSVISSYTISWQPDDNSNSEPEGAKTELSFSMTRGDILPNSASPLEISFQTRFPRKFSVKKETSTWNCFIENVETRLKQHFRVKTTGVKAVLEAIPRVLNYGSVMVGEEEKRTFQLSNMNEELEICWEAKLPVHFHCCRPCTGVLKARSSIKVGIIFRPRQLGMCDGDLRVSYNKTKAKIKLIGSGTTGTGRSSGLRGSRLISVPEEMQSPRLKRIKDSPFRFKMVDEATKITFQPPKDHEKFLTRKDLADCGQKLAQSEIVCIRPSSHRIDYGEMTIYQEKTEYLAITNSLSKYIKVELLMERCKNVRIPVESLVFAGPCSTVEFPITFMAEEEGSFFYFAEYMINGRYRFKIAVVAVAKPVTVLIGDKELNFAFNEENDDFTVSRSISLENQADTSAKLTFENPSKFFKIKKEKIILDPLETRTMEIIFSPDSAINRYKNVIKYKVRGGQGGSITCRGSTSERIVDFQEGHIDFGTISVGVRQGHVLKIINKSDKGAAIVAAEKTKLPHFVSVSPEKMKIPANRSAQATIYIRCTEQQFLDSIPIFFRIRGGKTKSIFMSAKVELPNVEIMQDDFDFGGVFIGNCGETVCQLRNQGNAVVYVIADLSRPVYSEFDIRPTELNGCKMGYLPTGDLNVLQSSENDAEMEYSQSSEKEKTRVMIFHMNPKTSIDFCLKFTPTKPLLHAFELPLHLIGRNEQTRSKGFKRAVTAEGLRPPLSLSTTSIVFGDAVVDLEVKTKKGTNLSPISFTIKNHKMDMQEWKIQAQEDSKFVLESYEGTLNAGKEAIITVKFAPKTAGVYKEDASFYFAHGGGWHFLEKICMRGRGVGPSIFFSVNRIVFTPVPPGVCVKARIYVHYNGHRRIVLEQPRVEDGALPISVNFINGNVLYSQTSRVQVEVSFSSDIPISFATRLVFKDRSRDRYVEISGHCSNSLLSFPSLFLSSRKGNDGYSAVVDVATAATSSPAGALSEDKVCCMEQAVTSVANSTFLQNCSILQLLHCPDSKGIDTNCYSSSPPQVVLCAYLALALFLKDEILHQVRREITRYVASIMDVFSSMKRQGKSEYRVEARVYHSNPFSPIISTRGRVVVDILRSFGVPEPELEEFGAHTMEKSGAGGNAGDSQCIGIDDIAGVVHVYDRIIRLLTRHGCQLSNLRPEYFLSFEEYQEFLVLPKAGGSYWSGNLGRTLHNMISVEAWTQLTLSLLQRLLLSRVQGSVFVPVKAKRAFLCLSSNVCDENDAALLYWAHANAEGQPWKPWSGYFANAPRREDLLEALYGISSLISRNAGTSSEWMRRTKDTSEYLLAMNIFEKMGAIPQNWSLMGVATPVTSSRQGTPNLSAPAALQGILEEAVMNPISLELLLLICHTIKSQVDASYSLDKIVSKLGSTNSASLLLVNPFPHPISLKLCLFATRTTPFMRDETGLGDRSKFGNDLLNSVQEEWSLSSPSITIKPNGNTALDVVYAPKGLYLSSKVELLIENPEGRVLDSMCIRISGKVAEQEINELCASDGVFLYKLAREENPFNVDCQFKATVRQVTTANAMDPGAIRMLFVRRPVATCSHIQDDEVNIAAHEIQKVRLDLLILNHGHTYIQVHLQDVAEKKGFSQFFYISPKNTKIEPLELAKSFDISIVRRKPVKYTVKLPATNQKLVNALKILEKAEKSRISAEKDDALANEVLSIASERIVECTGGK